MPTTQGDKIIQEGGALDLRGYLCDDFERSPRPSPEMKVLSAETAGSPQRWRPWGSQVLETAIFRVFWLLLGCS